MTYDKNNPTDNFKLYEDGVLVGKTTAMGLINVGNGIYHIGNVGYNNSNPTGYQIDEVRIWSRALTQEELVANQTRKDFSGEEALKLYLTFDQNTTLILQKDGESNLVSDKTTVIDASHVQARVNVDNAAVGDWTVTVKQGNTETPVAQKFKIEEALYPEVEVSITGRSLVLLNRYNAYTVSYSNKGNLDAYSVPLWLIIDDHEAMEVDFFDFTVDLPIALKGKPAAEQLLKEGVCYKVDTIDGQFRKARVYPLLIPEIRANSTGSITLRIKSPGDYNLEARIAAPWVVYTSEDSPEGSPMLRANDLDAGFEAYCCVMGIVAEGAIGLVPGVGCLYSGAKTAIGYVQTLRGKQSVGDAVVNTAATALDCAENLAPPLKIVKFLFSWGSTIAAMKECTRKYNEARMGVKAVAAIDPNEIVGPAGYGDTHWIRPLKEAPYQILFENKAEATAPAHVVFVTDTLNTEKFDLSSFSFGSFGWGDTIFIQDLGVVREFSRDIDLRPAKELIVRVTGKLDMIHAVVKFDFVSLNPTTMDEEEDPLLGFLPPNKENGEGEGFVSFTVGLKPVSSTGQTIENQAAIVFDVNAPILTNVYINTFDLDKPQSSISGTINNGKLELSWSGTDAGSGIAFYDVWLQKDDGPWQSLSFHTPETGAVIPVESYVKAYKFYCTAIDNAGWEQDESGDYQTVYTGIKNVLLDKEWEIYPNPVGDELRIKDYDLQTDDEIEIFDILGKRLISARQTTINVSALPQGIYFVRIGNFTRKFIKE